MPLPTLSPISTTSSTPKTYDSDGRIKNDFSINIKSIKNVEKEILDLELNLCSLTGDLPMSFSANDEIDGFKFKKLDLAINTPLGGNGKFHINKNNQNIEVTLGAGALGFGAEFTVGMEKEEIQRVSRPQLTRQSKVDKTGTPRLFIRT